MLHTVYSDITSHAYSLLKNQTEFLKLHQKDRITLSLLNIHKSAKFTIMSKIPPNKFWDSKTGLGTRNFTSKVKKYLEKLSYIDKDALKPLDLQIPVGYNKLKMTYAKIGVVVHSILIAALINNNVDYIF